MKIISVVVTYNAVRWIKKCFNSLITSKIDGEHTILAIDNCSKDETVKCIKEHFPQVEIIRSEINLGFGAANNIGFKLALERNADYVFLLNQDAWVEPDCIVEIIKVHTLHPELGILSPLHFNGSGSILDYEFYSGVFCFNSGRDLASHLLTGKPKIHYEVDFINAALWMIPITTIKRVGLFSPLFFFYGEDDNYVHRLKYHRLKIGLIVGARGCHDREDRPLRDIQIHDTYYHIFTSSLVRLADISLKRRFSVELMAFYMHKILMLIKSIARLKISRIFIVMKVCFNITLLLPKIVHERRKTTLNLTK